MPLVGFESAIPSIKWLQTYALDPRIPNLGKTWKMAASLIHLLFKHQENVPNSHCLRGWIDLIADVELVAKSTYHCRNPNTDPWSSHYIH